MGSLLPKNIHTMSEDDFEAAVDKLDALMPAIVEAITPLWHLGNGAGSWVNGYIYRAAIFEYGLPIPAQQSTHNRVSAATRAYVYERDGYACVKCGARKNLTIDHKIPRSKGGTNAIDNLQTMCYRHNHEKADKINGQ